MRVAVGAPPIWQGRLPLKTTLKAAKVDTIGVINRAGWQQSVAIFAEAGTSAPRSRDAIAE